MAIDNWALKPYFESRVNHRRLHCMENSLKPILNKVSITHWERYKDEFSLHLLLYLAFSSPKNFTWLAPLTKSQLKCLILRETFPDLHQFQYPLWNLTSKQIYVSPSKTLYVIHITPMHSTQFFFKYLLNESFEVITA